MAKHVVLLAVAVSILAALVLVGTAATNPPPRDAYHWAQPGCAPVSAPAAQLPARIAIAFPVMLVTPPASSFAWMQPGCAPVETPNAQPPAWIATG